MRQYNLPTANDEVAAIMPGDGSEEWSDHRDIVLRLNGGGLKCISHLHPSYASLHYVLLFPNGEDGWHTDIPSNKVQMEQEELPMLASIAMGDHDENINLEIILPSSHMGSKRQMNQLFQDSMAICHPFSKPDIFLTMMANPNWPEIQDALLEEESLNGGHRQKQSSYDRPDIVAHVFEQKKNAVLKEIKNGVFGKAVAHIHTIEFQKRGLPHMHLLILLDPADKIHNAHDIDSIVSAQL